MNVESFGCGFQLVVIQLLFFLYKSGEAMLDATTRPYIVHAVCKDLYSNDEKICHNIKMFPKQEDHVQVIAGYYLMFYRLVLNLPAVVLALFCGSYSDKYGRKIPMMLPSIGSVLGVLLYILSLMWPSHRIPLILIGATMQGMFGKSSVITMAVNSYVSDVTEFEKRSKQLGRLLAMNFFGLFAGSLLSAIFQEATDLPTTFCIVILIHSIVVIVTVFCVNETKGVISLNVNEKGKVQKDECCSLFTIANVQEAGVVLFRKRENNMRFLVLTLFVISVIVQTCKVGDMDVTVLFVSRTPLNWPRTLYGYLMSVDYAVMGFCLFFILPILTEHLKLSDASVLSIGISFKIVRLVWAGFCTRTWMVFASVAIGAFFGMTTSSLRSLLSKCVETDEAGKVFSLLACGETLSKLLGVTIFLNLYSATAHVFSGLAYMFEATVYVIVMVLIIFLFKDLKTIGTQNLIKQSWSDKKEYRSVENNDVGLDEESQE